MDFDDYQKKAKTTAIYPKDKSLEYLTIALAGEAGELANKVKKIIRGDYTLEFIENDLAAELGDILWYLSEFAGLLGYDLSVIAEKNIDSLRIRKQKNSIKGDGDNR